MEGCSKYCTFCVVPYTRGEEFSRPFDDVIAEVKEIAKRGKDPLAGPLTLGVIYTIGPYLLPELVKHAIDLGVNFLDTAQNYGTEPIVGKAIAGLPRERLVISTKKTLPPSDHPSPQAEVSKGLEESLKLLGTDYIDVYHLHGVEPKDYEVAKHRLMPAMRRQG